MHHITPGLDNFTNGHEIGIKLCVKKKRREWHLSFFFRSTSSCFAALSNTHFLASTQFTSRQTHAIP